MILNLATIHTTAAADVLATIGLLWLAIVYLQLAINKGPRRKK